MSSHRQTIWVCSYPKSGNTWMRHLLKEYYARVTGKKPNDLSDRSIYWYQVVSHKPVSMLTPDETIQLRPAAMAHMIHFFEQYKEASPVTLVKSHVLNGHTGGVPTFSPLWVDYAIYITRDPRDIAPSWAHHMGSSYTEAIEALGSRDSALGNPARAGVPALYEPVSTWSEHVLSWIEEPGVATIVTSYEEMHENTLGILAAIVKQIDGEVDIDAARAAVRECRFENLKRKEEEGVISDQPKHSDRPFYRKGEVSRGEELPRALRRRIIKEHGDVMKRLGYLDESD